MLRQVLDLQNHLVEFSEIGNILYMLQSSVVVFRGENFAKKTLRYYYLSLGFSFRHQTQNPPKTKEIANFSPKFVKMLSLVRCRIVQNLELEDVAE